MSDLERMHNNELQAWYRTWYAPNNATLIIVGDVQLDAVRREVEQYFAGFTRQILPHTKLPLQSAATGPRQVTVYDAFSRPRLVMAFNVPTYATAESATDVHALRLLDALLGKGLSARLNSRLERQQALLFSPRSAMGHWPGAIRCSKFRHRSILPNPNRWPTCKRLSGHNCKRSKARRQALPS